MHSSQLYIQNSIREITQFAMNDILVDTTNGKIVRILKDQLSSNLELDFIGDVKSIVQTAENNFKESGILPLCLSAGILKWEVKSKQIETPILLFPVSFKKIKATQKIEFEWSIDEVILNPFLVNYFHSNFDLTIPQFDFTDSIFEEISFWLSFQKITFELEENYFLGNFHHHRFHIIKDLEALLAAEKLNPNVEQLIGNEDKKNDISFSFTKQILYPSDTDHLQVYHTIENENCIIQGPPGTGKSQVLSNIIGKTLFNGNSTLVISEKRVALEVLEKKLSQVGLGDFLFVTTTETVSRDFLAALESSWNKMDSFIPERITNLQLSEQYKDYLQLQLDLLSKSELVGGVTFDAFHQLAKEIDFSSAPYVSDVPYINEWLIDQKTIAILYQQPAIKLLPFISFQFLKSASFEHFDKVFIDWKKRVEFVQKQFNFDSLETLDSCIKKAAICQFIENESAKTYFPILNPTGVLQKKYSGLRKRFLKAKKAVENLQNEVENWVEFPTENEASFLIELLQSSSFWKRRKAKNRIKKMAKSHFINPIDAFQNWKLYLTENSKLSIIKIEFREIGVNQPEIEVAIIDLLIAQLKENDWGIYIELSATERANFSQFHTELANVKSFLKSYFVLSPETKIESLFSALDCSFSNVIQYLKSIQNLNERSYRLLSKAIDFKEYEAIVFKSNWINFERYFPELAQFDPAQIEIKLNQIVASEEEEFLLFSKQIQDKIFKQFQAYHTLLQTTTARLSDAQKELKKRLKKGKSILVKEFAKTRNHPSVRELLQTEAKEWIQLLKPVWLSNPVQVSNCFPMQAEVFDVVIFDEASQIPLSNALGSIQRGKRIIIAGDEQQMGPSSFFKTGSEDIIDLLHQSNFYWQKVQLKHHYRSHYPELIQFSNQYFYQNSLIAYPSANTSHIPLYFLYCEDGIYSENQNLKEAQKTAATITHNLEKHVDRSIGIVAFSQTQLTAIWNALSEEVKSKLQEKLDANQAFFKSLENVQGEECDTLIISLGYAKNEEGNFHMRFGPLNQRNGSKRLNVLLSRAKETIYFISSVRSSDFKLTENESIRLLKLFLFQIENQKERNGIQFPYDLQPAIDLPSKSVTFTSIVNQLKDVNELVTMHRVLKGRGWKVRYD